MTKAQQQFKVFLTLKSIIQLYNLIVSPDSIKSIDF